MKCVLVIYFLVELSVKSEDVLAKTVANTAHKLVVNPRIVGGSEARPHSFPFQVYLRMPLPGDEVETICGGSLVSRTSVLTAAHCVEDSYTVYVLLGVHNISDTTEPSRVELKSPRSIIHPRYDPIAILCDIAIVKLPKSVNLNKNIALITWESHFHKYKNEIANVSGWGDISDSQETTTSILRYTSLKIITGSECKKTFSDLTNYFQICASGKGGKGSCLGDSGGPLTIRKNGKITQIGVVSFVHAKGCEKGYPTVYTRVSVFSYWIKENTRVTINYVASGLAGHQQLLLMLYFLIFFILNNFIHFFI